MNKIVLFLLMLFCTACVHAPDWQGVRPAVDLPRKQQDRIEEPREQGQEEQRQKEQSQRMTAKLNQRLQEIIADSPVRAKAEIFAPDPAKPEQRQEISFNFYDADLTEVVKVFMQVLEEDYLLHPEVQGRVSLSVQDEFQPEQILDILQGVLRVNGMAMIQGDGLWEILPQELASRHLGPQELIFPGQSRKPSRGQIIQGFRLKYIPAAEMLNIIKPYLTQKAMVYAHEAQGVLLVNDYPHALEKVAELIAQFDASVFADIQARIFALRYIQAEEAAKQLQSIAEQFGLAGEQAGPRSRISFLALERLNMVLAVTREEHVLQFIQSWIEGLDQEVPQQLRPAGSREIFVYYVQHGDAQEIVSSLRGLYEQGPDRKQGAASSAGQEESSADQASGEQESAQISGELLGQVQFNVDQTTNSIITRCNARDYEQIMAVIQKLDLYPKQVLIEVIIAEVTLKDTSRLGVDWRYLLSLGDSLDGLVEVQAGLDKTDTVATLSLASANRLEAALNAAVEDNQLQILSTPTLLASDNKPARINIGDQVPFPTSTRTRLDDTDTSEVIDTTFQYRDTGIILEVTPKINKQGMVRMQILQEVSNLSRERVTGIDAPVINTRHTSTSLAVGDQETVVIAGLMTQKRDKSSSGVPMLQRLPGLGHFFNSSRDQFENTELLVFITPNVILSQEDSSFLTKNFLQRLETVKAQMN